MYALDNNHNPIAEYLIKHGAKLDKEIINDGISSLVTIVQALNKILKEEGIDEYKYI